MNGTVTDDTDTDTDIDVNTDVSALLAKAVEAGEEVVGLDVARRVFERIGIPFNKSGLAKTPEEAVSIASELGYPVVLKIVSPQVLHKTEVGGVKTHINSDLEVKMNYDEIISGVKEKMAHAEVTGILVEEQAVGPEVIVGTTTDPQFGPMIMFGIGGIYVEVYKDVTFRLIPITAKDARQMLGEIKGKALLEGVRGLPKADPDQLVDVLMKISKLVEAHPEIREIDLNPLVVTKRGLVSIDARILLHSKQA